MGQVLLHKGQRRLSGQEQVSGELRRLRFQLLRNVRILRLLLPLIDHSPVLVTRHDLQKLKKPTAEHMPDLMGQRASLGHHGRAAEYIDEDVQGIGSDDPLDAVLVDILNGIWPEVHLPQYVPVLNQHLSDL